MRRNLRPTTVLLMGGFSVSLTAVLIGISSVDAVRDALAQTGSEAPIYTTMQNTGLSLALSLYLFSVVNGFAVTNYWIVTRQREMAIRKAFGWSNRQLVGLVARELAWQLGGSLGISALLLAVLARESGGVFALRLTPFFLLGTGVLLLLTLFLAMLAPVVRILKIRPAEVVA